MRRRAGFTLIELLVVIAIIAILMMLVAPQVGVAISKARETACRNNMGQILRASAAYAPDHDGVLPSAWSRGSSSTNEEQMCFVGREVTPKNEALSSDWPKSKYGTLVDYLGGIESARRIYRCPGLSVGQLRSGVGSNGYFDYVMFELFAGARETKMPSRAQVDFGAGTEEVLCPWLTEEDPAEYLNAGYMQPFHLSTDRMGAWHGGRANVGTASGSVVSFASKRKTSGIWKNPRAQDWRVRTPHGKDISMYSTAVRAADGWGWWNRQ